MRSSDWSTYVKITLRLSEDRLAHKLTIDSFAGLGVDEAPNYNSKAAEFAVAKILNLYPNIGADGKTGYLIARTHVRIRVVWAATKHTYYYVKDPNAEVFIVLVGKAPEFDMLGYCMRENIVSPAEQQYLIYDHILIPVDAGSMFLELLDD